MTTAKVTGTPSADILKNMGVRMYQEAYEKGMSLTAYLERFVDPSSKYDRRDPEGQTDAFGRILMAAGIFTRSVPQAGFWASQCGDFMKSEQTRALLPEFMSRVYRRVSHGPGVAQRSSSLYDPSDGAPGSWLNPYMDAAQPRWNEEIAPAIPISEIVAFTTPVTGNVYRALYMTHDAAEKRLLRVKPGADLPMAKIASGDHTINLYKYGRAMEVTYEDLRSMRVDRLAYHVASIAVQAEIDKLYAIVDVMVNGDTNANTAATNYNKTTLDSSLASGDPISMKAWLAFKMKFAEPYVCTTVIARESDALSLITTDSGTANNMLATLALPTGVGYFTQINHSLRDGTALGWSNAAPANVAVGFDRRRAIERVVEIGADIQEVEKVIRNQTQVFTLSETEGYCVFDQNATNTLTMNA